MSCARASMSKQRPSYKSPAYLDKLRRGSLRCDHQIVVDVIPVGIRSVLPDVGSRPCHALFEIEPEHASVVGH